MTLGKICRREVITITKIATILAAANLMKRYNIGDLIVVDEYTNAPLGILTDRDIVIEIIADKLDPMSVTVGDIMNTDLLLLKDYEDRQTALEMMSAKGVRRAPIINDNNSVVGIITIDDLIIMISEEVNSISKIIRKQIGYF